MIHNEGFNNLTFTAYIEVKRDRGKRQPTYLTRLGKWMAEQGLGGMVTEQILRTTKCRKLWRGMITNLTGLCKWMAEHRLWGIAKGQTLLRTTKDRKLWRVMTAQVLNVHSTLKKKMPEIVIRHNISVSDWLI